MSLDLWRKGQGLTPPGFKGGSTEPRYFGSIILPASMFRTSSCRVRLHRVRLVVT